MKEQAPAALVLLAALAVLHSLGLLDDRKPLGAYPKLCIMLGVAVAVAWGTNSRLLTMLDARVGGAWLSILITVLWIGVVTNAVDVQQVTFRGCGANQARESDLHDGNLLGMLTVEKTKPDHE